VGFQFKRGEGVPRSVRRVVTEQLDYAAAQLRGADPGNRDEAVHEARKSIKKVRAIIRLTYRELGPIGTSANSLLRELARKLSPFRDADVMVETLDTLKNDLNPRLLAQVRPRFLRERSKVARSPLPPAVPFALDRISERVRTWPLHITGFAALEPGLARTLQRGRKAFESARKSPSAEAFHEWRKRVKDLWYHVRLLEGLWTESIRAYERNLKELETALGDDHNLALLRERLAIAGNTLELMSLFAAIDRRQAALRACALELGDRLYGQKPAEFVDQVRQSWEAWQRPVKKSEASAA